MNAEAERPLNRGSGLIARTPLVVMAIASLALVAATVARSSATAPTVAGTVVNSQGRLLARLPITVYAQTSSHRQVTFQTETDQRGRFFLATPAAVDVLNWTATGAFPWYGGTWVRSLNTIGTSPGHLEFRADVVSKGQNSLATGALLRVDDWDGCDSLNGSSPAFVATNPGTQSIRLLLRPARLLVDASTGRAGTVTLSSHALCGFEGQGHQITLPAGAWTVTGVTDNGRPLAFSTRQGSGPYTSSLTVFDFPPTSSEPVEDIDVHFAS
jgi:hypothetical protein